MTTRVGNRPLVAGNWKMNGLTSSLVELTAIASGLSNLGESLDPVICPPATLIATASSSLLGSSLKVGAQDCSQEVDGAYTGDISAAMLVDSGAHYVILGHSERRHRHGETNADVARKVERCIEANMIAIVCIGETEEQMVGQLTETVLREQLQESIPDRVDCAAIAIAYEPVWAIGTGRVPTVSRIADLHAFIRQTLCEKVGSAGVDVRLLYGGSVKPGNADEISTIKDVDGVLVGGASLKASDFLGISAAFAK